MVLQNTGNAKLRGLVIPTALVDEALNSVTGLTVYSCKLDNTGSGLTLPQDLAAGHALHCTATYTFSDASKIEAGNLTFTPDVSATATVAGNIQQADALMVTVPSLPVIDVHLADATCGAATFSTSAPTIGMMAGLLGPAALLPSLQVPRLPHWRACYACICIVCDACECLSCWSGADDARHALGPLYGRRWRGHTCAILVCNHHVPLRPYVLLSALAPAMQAPPSLVQMPW